MYLLTRPKHCCLDFLLMAEIRTAQNPLKELEKISERNNKQKNKKSRNQVRREKKKLLREKTNSGAKLAEKNSDDKDQLTENNDNLYNDKKSNGNFYDTNKTDSVDGMVYTTIVDSVELDPNDPLIEQFKDVFNRFKADGQEKDFEDTDKGQIMYSDDEILSEGEEDALQKQQEEKLSKKKLRKLKRMTVAQLKMLSEKADVVEWWDVSSLDPLFLTHLKAYPNTVPVPRHWNQKRDYLSGQRGIERQLFELPSYIRATGIVQMRNAVHENEADMPLRQKMRERVQPKMGKLDIDYQKLHDAFFRYQTKPVLTGFGECYFEGKELEADVKEKRPGDISEELREALGIAPGAPPPWLFAMQRYGPPPSYPDLKIPGVNCPIPTGAQWGFHPGGWGKPPVDQFNRPLYGDVFGNVKPRIHAGTGSPVSTQHWGELEEFEEEESSEEEESEDVEYPTEEITERETIEEYQSASEPRSQREELHAEPLTYFNQSNVEVDNVELRKNTQPSNDAANRDLYQVLPEKSTNISGFMGPQHQYDIPTAEDTLPQKRNAHSMLSSTNKGDVALNQSSNWQDELSELVSEQAMKVGAAKRQKTQSKRDKFRL